jgi:hypothetical protein
LYLEIVGAVDEEEELQQLLRGKGFDIYQGGSWATSILDFLGAELIQRRGQFKIFVARYLAHLPTRISFRRRHYSSSSKQVL